MFARCSTTTFGSFRWSASHWVDTMGESNLAGWAPAAAGSANVAAASAQVMRAIPRRCRCTMIPRDVSGSEAVADFPDGYGVLRLGRVVLELLAQLGHVGIHRSGEHDRAMVPHLAQEIDARCNRALPLDERHHELVCLRR